MQAISTKYIGPSNVRGSRIKATCEAGSLTIGYPHELSGEDCHRKAAEALRDKLGWQGELIGGGTQTGYCFVFAPGYSAMKAALHELVQLPGKKRPDRVWAAAIDAEQAARAHPGANSRAWRKLQAEQATAIAVDD